MVAVGRSGAGKSTFINMFATLIAGKGYEDERCIAITQAIEFQDEGRGSSTGVLNCNIPNFKNLQSDDLHSGQNEAKTQHCSAYHFETDEYDITVVDTPGFLDPRGVEKDKHNAKLIVEEVAKLGTLFRIVLLVKATDTRADLSYAYLVNELKSLLPAGQHQKIIVVYTHVVNRVMIGARQALRALGLTGLIDKGIVFENDCLIPPQMLRQYIADPVYLQRQLARSSDDYSMNESSCNKLVQVLQDKLDNPSYQLSHPAIEVIIVVPGIRMEGGEMRERPENDEIDLSRAVMRGTSMARGEGAARGLSREDRKKILMERNKSIKMMAELEKVKEEKEEKANEDVEQSKIINSRGQQATNTTPSKPTILHTTISQAEYDLTYRSSPRSHPNNFPQPNTFQSHKNVNKRKSNKLTWIKRLFPCYGGE